MPERIVPAQEFETPGEALAHYGVKGMRWGVTTKDRGSGDKAGSASDDFADLAPLIAVTAIIAGFHILRARFMYVDSGRRDAKRLDKDHEWKKDESLAKPKTHEQLVNDVIPGINPGFPKTPGTSMNCRRCTFAYEMRRRGYDVMATKSLMATGQDMSGVVRATSPNATNKSVREQSSGGSLWGRNTIPTTVNGKQMTPEGKSQSIFDALASQPNGARGELAFSWSIGGGHSVAYEIVNNRPIIFCTQTQKSFSSAQTFASDYGRIVGDAAYTRLDNADLDQDFLKRWVANA